MRAALVALRELQAARALHPAKPDAEPLCEIVGLISGALLGSVMWILLLRLT
jgi:hypothetical protein